MYRPPTARVVAGSGVVTVVTKFGAAEVCGSE
jgi:hypothetical protein